MMETRDAAAFDGRGVEQSLDAHGNAVVPGLLSTEQCVDIAALYATEASYRSRVVMARHGFGRGEYKYFAYPLPTLLNRLRHELYPALEPIANRWNQQLGVSTRYPDELDAFLDRCHRSGQTRPDAAHPRVQHRGHQLLAPGSLWRACLSAARGDPTI
jgi:uncharacterized protein